MVTSLPGSNDFSLSTPGFTRRSFAEVDHSNSSFGPFSDGQGDSERSGQSDRQNGNSQNSNQSDQALESRGFESDTLASEGLDNAVPVNGQAVKALLKQAFVLRNSGNYKGAVDLFDQAIAQDPTNHRSLLYRAQTLVQMRDYDAAIEGFRNVLKLNPTSARAWHGQGVAKAELRLYPSAVDSFDRAIACDPNSDKVWYNRGRALLKLEQFERALQSFDKAVELNETKYHYWYNRALAQAALEHIQPAIESLSQTTVLKPSCHYAWNYCGTLLNRLFRHEEALKSFWESLQHRVPNPNAWYGLAATYALLNNPDAAAIHLTQAVQLNPSIYSLMARNDVNFDLVRNHPKVAKILQD